MLAGCARPTPSSPTAVPTSGVALKNMSVQLNFVANVEHYGVSYAQKAGIAQKYGLNLDMKPGGQGIDPLQMVAANQADVGVSDPTSILAATKSGANVVAFATEFQKSPVALTCRGDRGVNKVSELPGHTVGLKDVATPLFETFLARNNIKQSDLTIIPIGATDVTTIIAGKIDCQFTTFSVNEPNTMRKNGITPVIFLLADNNMPSQGNVYIAPPDKIKADPDEYVAFVKALQESWGGFVKDPNAAAAWVVDNRLVDGLDIDQQKAQATSMVELIQGPQGLLALDAAMWKGTAQYVHDAGTTPTVVDVAPILNLDIVTRATKP
jgi:NitT/TauT family transport system substrate-binding protein